MPEPTKEYADKLSTTPKAISTELEWRSERHRHKLRVSVLAPELNEVLELRAVIGVTCRSYSLLYKKMCIRRYDWRGRHTTRDGKRFDGPHKHTWHPIYADDDAYVPDDIDPNADPNEQLLQFLREQNISLAEPYQYKLLDVNRR